MNNQAENEYRTIQLQLIAFMRHGAINWMDLKDAADAMFAVRLRYERLFREPENAAGQSEQLRRGAP